jgi:hypothetical protein
VLQEIATAFKTDMKHMDALLTFSVVHTSKIASSSSTFDVIRSLKIAESWFSMACHCFSAVFELFFVCLLGWLFVF